MGCRLRVLLGFRVWGFGFRGWPGLLLRDDALSSAARKHDSAARRASALFGVYAGIGVRI